MRAAAAFVVITELDRFVHNEEPSRMLPADRVRPHEPLAHLEQSFCATRLAVRTGRATCAGYVLSVKVTLGNRS